MSGRKAIGVALLAGAGALIVFGVHRASNCVLNGASHDAAPYGWIAVASAVLIGAGAELMLPDWLVRPVIVLVLAIVAVPVVYFLELTSWVGNCG